MTRKRSRIIGPRRAIHLVGARRARHRVNPLTAKYLNRLSDLLFILFRVASTDSHGGTSAILWCPVGSMGGRDFPKVTAPLDPDSRKKEW